MPTSYYTDVTDVRRPRACKKKLPARSTRPPHLLARDPVYSAAPSDRRRRGSPPSEPRARPPSPSQRRPSPHLTVPTSPVPTSPVPTSPDDADVKGPTSDAASAALSSNVVDVYTAGQGLSCPSSKPSGIDTGFA